LTEKLHFHVALFSSGRTHATIAVKLLKDLFRPFFFKFSFLLGLHNDFPGLALRELLDVSPKTLSITTTAVILPVFEFSIAISLALVISTASLVALIGRVSVDSKSKLVF
jgi:hypothetical protein